MLVQRHDLNVTSKFSRGNRCLPLLPSEECNERLPTIYLGGLVGGRKSSCFTYGSRET
jgi:hypothetical protein